MALLVLNYWFRDYQSRTADHCQPWLFTSGLLVLFSLTLSPVISSVLTAASTSSCLLCRKGVRGNWREDWLDLVRLEIHIIVVRTTPKSTEKIIIALLEAGGPLVFNITSLWRMIILTSDEIVVQWIVVLGGTVLWSVRVMISSTYLEWIFWSYTLKCAV